jgi:hypothetical protein
MDITTTVAMNLVFLTTLGIGFALFCCHLILAASALVLVGVGRLTLIVLDRLARSFSSLILR